MTSGIVESVRNFNRFYALKAGAFNEKIFESDFSLTEIRVLYELSLHESTTATYLSKHLSLDCGYLSRILNNFDTKGLVKKERSIQDARQRTLSLTPEGYEVAMQVSSKASESVVKMLEPLSAEEQKELVDAMAVILRLLGMNNIRQPSEA